jgi:apolipoprotein N-acyltransferase
VRRALAFPAAMTVAGAGRMRWPFGGLPLGGVFLGQAGGPVINVARLGGPLLLTAVVFVGGVAVAALARALVAWAGPHLAPGTGTGTYTGTGANAHGSEAPTPDGNQPRHARRGSRARVWTEILVGGIALAVVVVATVGGAVAPDGGPARGVLTAAAIQGGGKRGFSKEQINPATVYAAQFAATAEMQRLDHGHAPQMVLWPEDVVSLSHPLAGSHAEKVLGALARSLHTTLIAGVTATVSSTHFRNEAVAWGPNGAEVAHYEKVHRVPFGEYIPYRGFFKHIANLSAVPLNAIPGHKSGLLRTPAGPIGTMISFEVFFADRGRSAVRAGADVLILPTNTSSYANAQVPTQEVAASEIQAVEEGRNLLQAAPTGYSDIVTPDGAVRQRSVLGRRQVLVADVGLRHGLTVFARLGEVPTELAAGFFVAVGWLLSWRRRRTAPVT